MARLLAGPRLPILFAAVYALAYLARYPLLKWYAIPQTTFYKITPQPVLTGVSLALTGLLLFLLCWRMGRLARVLPRRTALLLIVAGWLGASLAAVLTYPGQSTDMGDYLFRAHMLIHLGANPMTTPPSQLIKWQDFSYLSWYWEPDFYGPLWYGLAGVLHRLAGESILTNFLAYKLLALVETGGAGLLIYTALRRLAPRYAAAGLALWLWNPVTINEGALHGHNDFTVFVLLLGGLSALLLNRPRTDASGVRARVLSATMDIGGVVLLIGAGLIKANYWVLLPVAAVWLLRTRGWRGALVRVAFAALIGAGLVWLAYQPFGGWGLLAQMAQKRGWWPANTWTAALFFALRDGARVPHAVVVRWVIGGATAVFGLLAGVLLLRVRELRALAWSVALAYVLVGSHWFQPWYFALPIALAALLPDRRIAHYTLVASFFMLLFPILAPVIAALKLAPGVPHALMALTTLFIPQVLAVRLTGLPRIARMGRILRTDFMRNS